MKTRALILAISCFVVTAGCAFDPSSVPLPGTSVSGPTYPLHIEFANVLNLPPGAKVYADGLEVGNLTGLQTITTDGAGGYVRADIEVKESVKLPTKTTAELRQAAPLSDIHIALTTAGGDFASLLGPGDTIPLSQTVKTIAVEDTMAGLATAAGNGTFRDFQDIVRQVNAVLPERPEDSARIFGVVGADIEDVAANLHTVDALLDGVGLTLGAVISNTDAVDRVLTEYGVQHLTDVIKSVVNLLVLFSNAAPLAHAVQWLEPLVNSLDGTAKAIVPMLFGSQPLDTKTPSNMRKLVDLIENKIVPFVVTSPKIDLSATTVSVHTDALSTTDQTQRIVSTLRMIGAVR